MYVSYTASPWSTRIEYILSGMSQNFHFLEQHDFESYFLNLAMKNMNFEWLDILLKTKSTNRVVQGLAVLLKNHDLQKECSVGRFQLFH